MKKQKCVFFVILFLYDLNILNTSLHLPEPKIELLAVKMNIIIIKSNGRITCVFELLISTYKVLSMYKVRP